MFNNLKGKWFSFGIDTKNKKEIEEFNKNK